MIYQFSDKRASIAIIGNPKITLRDHKIQILAGFFNYKKIILSEFYGINIAMADEESVKTRKIQDVYDIETNIEDVEIKINFFYKR